MRKVPSLYYERDLKNLAAFIGRQLAGAKLVLDVGGTGESDFHKWFSEDVRRKIINVNLPQMDARDLPFKGACADAVISFNTLEHIDDDDRAIGEMQRVLRPGGFLCVTVPFLESFHGYPDDYRRYTKMELDRKFSWLANRKIAACAYFGSALAVNMVNAIAGSSRYKGALAAYGLFWLKYLDAYYRRKPDAWKNALCIYLMGRKKKDLAYEVEQAQSFPEIMQTYELVKSKNQVLAIK